MEKVKIFTSNILKDLESDVNRWFTENNKKIDVVSRKMMRVKGVNREGERFMSFIIAIFYRPK